MKLVIGKAEKAQKEGFYIRIEFMHGDADGDTFETIGPFHEDKFDELEGFVKFLDLIVDGKYNYKQRRNERNAEWPEWCMQYIDWVEGKDWTEQPYFSLYDMWPGDHTCDYQYRASLEDYTFYYIDKSGRKFNVKVEK